MIGELQASWSLFGDSYLAGWLIAVLLSVVGVWVVARDQIFLGAAVSQASTLGAALALWLEGVAATVGSHSLGSDALTALLAVTASVATALLTSRATAPGRESPEALTGWVYLIGASVPVLMLASSPHGLEEVQRLLISSILGASRADVWLFLALVGATAVGVPLLRRRIVLFAMDSEMAAAVGMPARRWRLGTALWLGVAVGLSIHCAGMLYSFGILVLPALVARSLCREVAPMFAVAPAVALGTAVPGFLLADRLDVPPAQLAVALLCGLLALAWGLRARLARS